MIPGVFALFYAANLDHLFQPVVYNRFVHYWSLSQEEQFYLVWPALLAWVLWRRVSLAKMAYILAALAGIAMIHRATSSNSLLGPDMRADGMLLGCSLAAGWKSGLLRPSPRWRLAGAVGAVVFAVAATTMPTSSQALYGITVGVIASVVIVASIILEPLGPLPRLLASRPLVWLGKISYSLYIWHIFVAQSLSGPSMIAVSIVVAWLSYHLIEQPFRRRRVPVAAAFLKQQLSPASPTV
jgi:peptidoglycan/LPS O-acetylase OafA/YrhL